MHEPTTHDLARVLSSARPAFTHPGEPGFPDEPEEPAEPTAPSGPERSPAPWHDPGPPVRRVNLPPNSPSPGIPLEEPGQAWPTGPQ